MTQDNACVATFGTHTEAEDAVRKLQNGGFDMAKLSILGKGYHSEEHVTGYYTTGDRMMSAGKFGAFWGGLWGILVGGAFFAIPGIGPVVAAGPLVAAIVGAVQGAAIVGGLSAIVAGLVGLGVPKDAAIKYETALKADKFLLVAHGAADAVEKARGILQTTEPEVLDLHVAEAA